MSTRQPRATRASSRPVRLQRPDVADMENESTDQVGGNILRRATSGSSCSEKSPRLPCNSTSAKRWLQTPEGSRLQSCPASTYCFHPRLTSGPENAETEPAGQNDIPCAAAELNEAPPFVDHYNNRRLHSAIGFITPGDSCVVAARQSGQSATESSKPHARLAGFGELPRPEFRSLATSPVSRVHAGPKQTIEPEMGAESGSSARSDLRGGRPRRKRKCRPTSIISLADPDAITLGDPNAIS